MVGVECKEGSKAAFRSERLQNCDAKTMLTLSSQTTNYARSFDKYTH